MGDHCWCISFHCMFPKQNTMEVILVMANTAMFDQSKVSFVKDISVFREGRGSGIWSHFCRRFPGKALHWCMLHMIFSWLTELVVSNHGFREPCDAPIGGSNVHPTGVPSFLVKCPTMSVCFTISWQQMPCWKQHGRGEKKSGKKKRRQWKHPFSAKKIICPTFWGVLNDLAIWMCWSMGIFFWAQQKPTRTRPSSAKNHGKVEHKDNNRMWQWILVALFKLRIWRPYLFCNIYFFPKKIQLFQLGVFKKWWCEALKRTCVWSTFPANNGRGDSLKLGKGEIPRPTTCDVHQNLVNNEINYQPQLVIAEFLNHSTIVGRFSQRFYRFVRSGVPSFRVETYETSRKSFHLP